MTSIEVVLALLVVTTILAGLARRTRLPEPIVLVLAGLLIGLFPGLPHIELEPELVFLFFLPPILYAAGFFTSIRDFRANLRPILLLSVGLVLVTTVGVAWVLKALVQDIKHLIEQRSVGFGEKLLRFGCQFIDRVRFT